VEVSQYVLEALRRDEEFVLYRGEHSDQSGSPSVLLLAPASMQPALGSIKKIEHEYSLRDELDSSWAVRPLALSAQSGQMTLVLEDPGGETLDRFRRASKYRRHTDAITLKHRYHRHGKVENWKPTAIEGQHEIAKLLLAASGSSQADQHVAMTADGKVLSGPSNDHCPYRCVFL
jgi:hypothetical protein